jgi:RimJ/RimL family protein N-acetyltransferase
MTDLNNWNPRPKPARIVLEGRYCRLEPLDLKRHGEDLFATTNGPGSEALYRYLSEGPFESRAELDEWFVRRASSDDPLFFAVIDTATGRCEGRQALMRITPEHGVIEVGNVLWGPGIARTRVATEALFLHARYVFDDLGYRRFEWKCNSENAPSRRAAERFGFQYEGLFRQHMIHRGGNRDSTWFSMIDSEWPSLRAGFERWLAPENFDSRGQQKTKLVTRSKP